MDLDVKAGWARRPLISRFSVGADRDSDKKGKGRLALPKAVTKSCRGLPNPLYR